MNKKIILISILLMISLPLIFSDIKLEKVAVINLDEIIQTVFSGKSGVLQEIKKDKEELQNALNKIKENIAKLEAMRSKTNDQNQKIEIDKKIEEQEKLYNSTYRVKNYEIEKKINTIKPTMLKEIYAQVKRIAENDGYSLVLDAKSDNLFYYSVDADITSKVIEYFNKNYGDKKDGQR